jgi:hypothetical protein
LGCWITDDIPPEPVFGMIDFQKGSGSINMPASDCKDIPFVINKQSPDKLRISINPGEEIVNCFGSTGSILHYQGESDTGKCNDDSGGSDDDSDDDTDVDPEDNNPDDNDGKDPAGGGGGGGGCFITELDQVGCLSFSKTN